MLRQLRQDTTGSLESIHQDFLEAEQYPHDAEPSHGQPSDPRPLPEMADPSPAYFDLKRPAERSPPHNSPEFIQSQQPAIPTSPAYWGEDLRYPPRSTPPANLFRPSTISTDSPSTRTLTSVTQAPRRAPLGPPPSSRRGAPNYYSHEAHVTPIIEESESYRSRNSLASNLVPDRQSQARQHDDETGVVRQASVGHARRPSLMMIGAGSSSSSSSSATHTAQAAKPTTTTDNPFVGSDESKPSSKASSTRGGLSGVTGVLDTSSESDVSHDQRSTGKKRDGQKSTRGRVDSRVDQILGGLEKGGLLMHIRHATHVRSNRLEIELETGVHRTSTSRPLVRLNLEGAWQACLI